MSKIPKFNSLEELNKWLGEEFGFDCEYPLEQLLADYINARKYLCAAHNLLTAWETGEPLEELEEPEGSEEPVKYESMKMPPAFRAIIYPEKIITNSIPLAERSPVGMVGEGA